MRFEELGWLEARQRSNGRARSVEVVELGAAFCAPGEVGLERLMLPGSQLAVEKRRQLGTVMRLGQQPLGHFETWHRAHGGTNVAHGAELGDAVETRAQVGHHPVELAGLQFAVEVRGEQVGDVAAPGTVESAVGHTGHVNSSLSILRPR